MNILTKITLGASLLLTSVFATAAYFDIVPGDTFSEIDVGNFGVLRYEVELPSTSRYKAAGIPKDGLPVGVRHLFTSNPSKPVSCGPISVTLDSDSCSGVPCEAGGNAACFDLSPERPKCNLFLCVNGTEVDKNLNHKAIGGPTVCGDPLTSPPSHCSHPFKKDEINITAGKFNANLVFTTANNFLPNNTALLQPGGTFTWNIANTSTTTPAQAVRALFNSAILSQLSLLDDSDCFDKPLTGPPASCNVIAVVKASASINPNPQTISFRGTNTNPLIGHVIFDTAAPLTITPLTFHAPGTEGQVSMTLTNTSSSSFPILIAVSGGISFTGINPGTVSVTGGTCPTVSGNYQVTTSCTLIFQATADAYLTSSAMGQVQVQYSQGSYNAQATADISIDDTVLLINNGIEIDIPTIVKNNKDDFVTVPLANKGAFNLHGLAVTLQDITGVDLQPLTCTDPLTPIDETCNAILKITGTPTAGANPLLIATGDNILTTQQNISVGEVVIQPLPPQSQYLQYQGVKVSNNFPVGSGINLLFEAVEISASLSADVDWCESTDIATCDQVSTCATNIYIAPGDDCTTWFKSLDNNKTPMDAPITGTVTIKLSESVTPPGEFFEETFNVTKQTNLYVAGEFALAGSAKSSKTAKTAGVPANNIAKWNSTNGWFALGTSGLNSFANALALYQGNLVVGGGFSSADTAPNTKLIASWNGNNWNSLSNGLTGAVVDALIVKNNILYAGGSFSGNGDSSVSAANIITWDNSNWSPLGGISGNGTNITVSGLADFNNGVYLAGPFTQVSTPAISAYHVAGWLPTNSWGVLGSAANNGANSTAIALLPDASSANVLHVGGLFAKVFDDTNVAGLSSPGVASFNLDPNNPSASVWSTLGNNTTYFNILSSTVQTLVNFNGNIFAGGSQFYSLSPNSFAAKLAGGVWGTVGTLNAQVVKLYNYNNAQLYAGGSFYQSTVDTNLNGLALYDGSDWKNVGGGLTDSMGTAGSGIVEDILVASSLTITP